VSACATLRGVWSTGLASWFAANGRHQLPWRQTVDPWAVLVSEVMLQQTSVARVLPRWGPFLDRWPSPAGCAASELGEVLLAWQGLGYPRRARALWLTAAAVASGGWPRDEAGLRALPGVGAYTARALLAFSHLGSGATSPPRDVNLSRVAARAGLGREPGDARGWEIDGALVDGRPAVMGMREYAYALFDVGSLHCRARPRCAGCPLAHGCRAEVRRGPVAAARAQPRYAGSLRQLRGAVLAHALASPQTFPDHLADAVGHVPGATPERIQLAVQGLLEDGLVGANSQAQR
jgi:A/G-specific adenine glycosylase